MLLFTENETNAQRLYGVPTHTPYVKDAFHEYVVQNNTAAVNPQRQGTKAAAWYTCQIPAGPSAVIRLRLRKVRRRDRRDRRQSRRDSRVARPRSMPFSSGASSTQMSFMPNCKKSFSRQAGSPPQRLEDMRACSGKRWPGCSGISSFIITMSKNGWWATPASLHRRPSASAGATASGRTTNNREVLSMPDKWEYPWYAAWDSGVSLYSAGAGGCRFC